MVHVWLDAMKNGGPIGRPTDAHATGARIRTRRRRSSRTRSTSASASGRAGSEAAARHQSNSLGKKLTITE